ncbi:zinc finger protein Xfin-like isoform X1 [Pararge aegeria]|uniref:zinc finger protein Xfin-like isoform X1 n=2 Tax=Pararge aegeria TaxID=116150 RepID=UPI0019D0C703|nr:zinc finger protein Xfin-like isoform X1 [Pararge aegeria]
MEIQDAVLGDFQNLKKSNYETRIHCSNTDDYIQKDNTSTQSNNHNDQNLLKLVSVTSIPSHCDLWQKQKQDNNLQGPENVIDLHKYPKQESDLKVEIECHIHDQNDEHKNFQQYTQLNQTSSDPITQQCIEVKNEIKEELNPPCALKVKDEVTSDHENDICNVKNNTEDNLSCQNVFDFNITIKDEFTKNIVQIEQFISADKMAVNKKDLGNNSQIDNAVKGTENVDGTGHRKVYSNQKKKKTLSPITNTAVSKDKLTVFKCAVCAKVFLGNDAYKEHMKKHSIQDHPSSTGPSGVLVLKVGDPLLNKCTIVKVKQVKSKLKTKEEFYEEILTSYYDRIKVWSQNGNNCDGAKNKSDSAQNTVQTDCKTVNVENVNVENVNVEPPTVVKLIKKKRRMRRSLTMSVTSKKCDDNCTNDESCKQSQCKKVQKPNAKHNINSYFSCNQCDYKCKYKKVLRKHKLKHVRVKTYRCQWCEYKCLKKTHLDQHLSIHTQTKPYSCNYCEYDCIQRSDLDSHIRTHIRVKPFSCNLCDFICTQRGNLDEHMRLHTDIKPYSCILCDYVCVQRAHLNDHITKIHTNL